MKKIGNIITNLDYQYPEYLNVSDTLDIDNSLPTLVVGFDLAKELFPNQRNAANNHIIDKIFWTFGRLENRSKFDLNLENFIRFCFYNQIENINYIFLDLIHSKPSKLFKITKKILSLRNPISFQYKDMCYIYSGENIFGIDLNLCQFVDLDRDKIFNKIISISSVTLTYDDIIIEYENLLEKINNEVKFLPILYSIKNGTS